jgi:phage N-6-adenine-methyltransferase
MFDVMTKLEDSTNLAYYDPQRGLKSIAVTEAAEKHWRRAKNSDKLFEAVKQKLTEQAKYVVWRDSVVVPSRKRGGPGRGKKGAAELSPVLTEDDPGKDVVKRWRKRLCLSVDGETLIDGEKITKEASRIRTIIDEGKLALTLKEAHLRCQRVCEDEPKGTERGTAGTGEFERYTPAKHIEAVRDVLGTIDLDPASTEQAQQTVKAETFFTEKDDGLERTWHGKVFLNPPYHRELAPAFVAKLVEEVKAGRVTEAIMLMNSSTDTEWFRKAAEKANTICFTYGRIAFTTPGGEEVAPTQGQAFFYYGNNVRRFIEVFGKIGIIATVICGYQG